jgi:acyl-CoA reductase-like NAD-dependent aldehyde dehydrogenase
MQEEIFGPVCAIAKFNTEEEVLKMGNDTVYGLAAAVHTQDLNTAIRVSNALNAGTVWVNCYKFVHLLLMLEKTLLTPSTSPLSSTPFWLEYPRFLLVEKV